MERTEILNRIIKAKRQRRKELARVRGRCQKAEEKTEFRRLVDRIIQPILKRYGYDENEDYSIFFTLLAILFLIFS